MNKPAKENLSLGKLAVFLALQPPEETAALQEAARQWGYRIYQGKVGSMDSAKIFAAIETAAKRENLIGAPYREEHALYHSILEAYHGICRGQTGLGNVLRSAGLLYSIVRGARLPGDNADGEWVAVAIYGSMGAPVKGFEHEVLGLGMNPV